MTLRKQPSAAFWLIVVLAALVAYPLSFGPACWLATRATGSSPGRAVVLYGYYPMLRFAHAAPEPVNQAVVSYARWMARDGSSPGLLGNGSPTWYYPPPPALLGK